MSNIPFNEPIVKKQLATLLTSHAIPFDLPFTLKSFRPLDDGQWHVEFAVPCVPVPVYVHVVKSFMDLPGGKRVAPCKVAGLNLGGLPEWLKDAPAADAPPKLEVVPAPEPEDVTAEAVVEP